MIITEIRQLSKQKMQVFLDGEPAFIANPKQIRELGIEESTEIPVCDEDVFVMKINKMAAKTAMDLLVRRDYSRKDLYRKLQERGFADDYCDWAIQYVDKFHYIDDERLAKHQVMLGKDSISRQMMMKKLRDKGLQDEIIQSAIGSDWDDNQAILRQIRKKVGEPDQIACLPEDKKQKLMMSLLRKGFKYGDIKAVLGTLNCMPDNDNCF